MSKIVLAVNAMVSNRNRIESLAQAGNLIWFTYDGKHKWSIAENKDEYYLCYYTGDITIHDLIKLDPHELDEYEQVVIYRTSELKTREAFQSFRDLYKVAKEKLYNVDGALDDIIGTSGLSL